MSSPNQEIIQTFIIKISSDTANQPDLVLRQLLRQLPGWFSNLSPVEIVEVLESEARHLTAKYPLLTEEELRNL